MLVYEQPPDVNAPLRQGELLANLWEHRSLHPTVQPAGDEEVRLDYVEHPLVLIMTADCDLEQDHRSRFSNPQPLTETPAMLRQVQILDAYVAEEAIAAIQGSDIKRRVRQNQDERYHLLNAAPIGTGDGDS